MATIQVNEPFFDITLTSDGFQNEFPNNTVGSFKARMPAKLVLRRPYKVALHKLSFTNAINNVGKKINTRLWFTDSPTEPARELNFPEASIDDSEDFVQTMNTLFRKQTAVAARGAATAEEVDSDRRAAERHGKNTPREARAL